MDTIQLIRRVILTASVALIAGVAIPPAQAAETPAKPVASTTPSTGLSLTASGAVEDNLKRCLGRIPKDSSSGQRLIAEQGCGRDQETRKSIDAVPGH